MKIAYASTFDAKTLSNPNNWAGTGYYIPESLKKQSISVQYVDSLKEQVTLQAVCKLKRHYYEFFTGTKYLKALDPLILRSYSNQISQKLARTEANIVFSATIAPIVYLDCHHPIAFWADATFKDLLNFYPQFTGLCEENIQQGHQMERLALQRSSLAIYSSDWAAQTAIDYYNADPAKVKVVPFGANVESYETVEEIKELIESRPRNKCKLLFLGVDWFRKGGDLALEIAIGLNHLGLDTELTVVGCEPVFEGSLPDFIKPLGFISKSTHEGRKEIYRLIANSHFLILPSIADCTPIVFCEATSLGVPCLARRVGGIPTIIKDDLNGKLFDPNSNADEYCEYIFNYFTNFNQYKNLALSAFHEYESRLNWNISGQKVKELLMPLHTG
ncbi:MAG: glycosyltransferase family 4 protein [Myxacorys californica WJT36-NPBG1]|nr:glycosyltransferase family 4 protein [Myxacorys californica WJT36-NPBG1]